LLHGRTYGSFRVIPECAQRLAASLPSAPSCPRVSPRDCRMCSTPRGVTAFCTPASEATPVGPARCSTPRGVTAFCTYIVSCSLRRGYGAQRLAASLPSAPPSSQSFLRRELTSPPFRYGLTSAIGLLTIGPARWASRVET